MLHLERISATDPKYGKYETLMDVACAGDCSELVRLVGAEKKLNPNFYLQKEDGRLSPTFFQVVRSRYIEERTEVLFGVLKKLIKKGAVLPKEPAGVELSPKVLAKIEKVRAYNLEMERVREGVETKPVNREPLEVKFEEEYSSFCPIL
jgi:hypothetical protein